MYIYALNNTPNQTFTTTLNNINMEVTIKTGGATDNPITFFAIQRGDEYLCPFVPCFANQVILPYDYMQEELGGNFFFQTENDENPYFENFGTSCLLYYATTEELNG